MSAGIFPAGVVPAGIGSNPPAAASGPVIAVPRLSLETQPPQRGRLALNLEHPFLRGGASVFGWDFTNPTTVRRLTAISPAFSTGNTTPSASLNRGLGGTWPTRYISSGWEGATLPTLALPLSFVWIGARWIYDGVPFGFYYSAGGWTGFYGGYSSGSYSLTSTSNTDFTGSVILPTGGDGQVVCMAGCVSNRGPRMNAAVNGVLGTPDTSFTIGYTIDSVRWNSDPFGSNNLYGYIAALLLVTGEVPDTLLSQTSANPTALFR